MADGAEIRILGAGSQQDAARLGQAIGDGVAAAVAGREAPLRIDALRLRLPAGVRRAELERAIRAAIAAEQEGR